LQRIRDARIGRRILKKTLESDGLAFDTPLVHSHPLTCVNEFMVLVIPPPTTPPIGENPNKHMARRTAKKAARKKVTKKSASKKASGRGAKKKATGDLIISKSRTKAAASINVSGEFYAALDAAVRNMIATAERRATDNNRRTLRPHDL
jgi:hypothetical protein